MCEASLQRGTGGLVMIEAGPFKDAVTNPPKGMLHESYTRRVIKHGWIIEEQWTRSWSKGDYIDSMHSTPICKLAPEASEI